MKNGYIVFAFLMFSTIHVFSQTDRYSGYWDLISETPDSSIEEGYFVIEGFVMGSNDSKLLSDVQLGTYTKAMYSRLDGKFSLELSCEESLIYFQKKGYEQAIFEGLKFKSQTRFDFNVYLDPVVNEVIFPPAPPIRVVAYKPVIYCYGDQEQSVSIKLRPKGEFTFTYPEYNDGWNIELTEQGLIKDQYSEKQYPYLFWEAEIEKLNYKVGLNGIEGFLVNTDTIIPFLESKLTLLGLNDIEKTDFITFWGPKLTQNPFALIQFLTDEDYQTKIAELDVNPEPHSCRRVYMLASPLKLLDTSLNIVPQELNGFNRSGFVLVEWGGSIINLPYQRNLVDINN